MAIKVVEQPITYGHRCTKCDAFLHYNKQDIENIQVHMNEYYEGITCPICGETQRVKKHQVKEIEIKNELNESTN